MSGKPNEPFVGKVIGFPNVTFLLLLHNVKPFWYFGKIILNRCPIDAVLTNNACLMYVPCCVQARRCSSLVLSCICYLGIFFVVICVIFLASALDWQLYLLEWGRIFLSAKWLSHI